jgi:uncharacterized protein YgbK (DUF1537 family)
VLQQLMEPDRLLFKKIDSTLRGQPASETAAALAHLKAQSGSAFGIFAPAFPATNRTTIDGRVVVGGRPLERPRSGSAITPMTMPTSPTCWHRQAFAARRCCSRPSAAAI